MFDRIKAEIDATMARDPAARSRLEVVLCYPGFQALMLHRLANRLWKRDWHLLSRCISHIGRIVTGIEIHPGATIGKDFFIDHGMGVVIGETSHIGDNVTLYHGVTLGGVAPSVDSDAQRGVKRHPTLECGVIVGSGAQILGPITVARCARIGANAVVTKDVPRCATVVGIPGKVVNPKPAVVDDQPFVAYGTPTGDIPDPVARTLEGLLNEVQSLRQRLNALEGQEDYQKNLLHNKSDATKTEELVKEKTSGK
ncbi:serine O-acetyltransferase [Kiloniella laminariae]|uniref:Serine acetyltransferase n=1 Tax=Kiloniella laminariae TaxID=454162 RepID=A0ABT4LED2_9PROT|nr:serine O-acetyltransferase [Kiloniella laminariae]MCZ4279455.1 serine O-acetyltransferase [Kiloniella laminariae]